MTELNFVCPTCKGELEKAEGKYLCRFCPGEFPFRYGIPDFRLRNKEMSRWDLNNSELIIRHYHKCGFEELYRLCYQEQRQSHKLSRKRQSHVNLEQDTYLRGYRSFGRLRIEDMEELAAGKRLEIQKGVALDLGCGRGKDLYAMSEIFSLSYGADILFFTTLLARRLMEENNKKNVIFFLGEGESLPFKNSSFDYINMTGAVEHLEHPEEVLRECNNLLKKNGIFFFNSPNRCSLLPEPHTSLYGVGFLPRPLQLLYVNIRTKQSFKNTKLYSLWELEKMLKFSFGGKFVITAMTKNIFERARLNKISRLIGEKKIVLLIWLYRIIEKMPLIGKAAMFFAPEHTVIAWKEGKGD